jgi:hypothetical protein
MTLAGQSFALQAQVLRDIHPFREPHVPFVPPQAATLARLAYQDRQGPYLDPVTLLALADCLEENGYPDQDLCPWCDEKYPCKRCQNTGLIPSALLNHLRGRDSCYCCIGPVPRGGRTSRSPHERCSGTGWIDVSGHHLGCWAADAILHGGNRP